MGWLFRILRRLQRGEPAVLLDEGRLDGADGAVAKVGECPSWDAALAEVGSGQGDADLSALQGCGWTEQGSPAVGFHIDLPAAEHTGAEVFHASCGDEGTFVSSG